MLSYPFDGPLVTTSLISAKAAHYATWLAALLVDHVLPSSLHIKTQRLHLGE